jgi:hypothetical protein
MPPISQVRRPLACPPPVLPLTRCSPKTG